MSKLTLIISLNFFALLAVSQEKKLKWQDVKVVEFTKRGVPDSLEICGGEWFVDGVAKNMAELDNQELERIKKKGAEFDCSYVFVDLKKVFTPISGQLYILGLKRKAE